MSLAACLLAYSMVVAVLGPPLLARATRSGAAPRAGMLVWAAAMAGVLGSWALATVLLAADLVRAWGQVDRLLAGCFATLATAAAGGYGGVLQAILAVVTASSVLTVGVLAARVTAWVRRARVHTRRHAEAAVLAARGVARGPGGSVVLDAAQPSVYCLAGGPATIVVTSGALAALDEAQLAAVLAHERAHLDERHHQMLAMARALSKILPGLRLFTDGAGALARLAEMRADDAAAKRHGPDTVVGALLALTAARHPVPAPAGGGRVLGRRPRRAAAVPARLGQGPAHRGPRRSADRTDDRRGAGDHGIAAVHHGSGLRADDGPDARSCRARPRRHGNPGGRRSVRHPRWWPTTPAPSAAREPSR